MTLTKNQKIGITIAIVVIGFSVSTYLIFFYGKEDKKPVVVNDLKDKAPAKNYASDPKNSI